ncbi:DUF6193 family natural product biosynthesis protein [Streptomyces microflavus]|uniref:Uncharacterized protein n=1 Tax=Streptomyces microflavus TaxID=1919 RepID=A0A7J0CRG4_STRMI|nr:MULTISPECIES: DUF6193 family natural product biosynthesis protein [Streptomyces]MCX4653414.1 DUF6193 family natural product biosynthesis protein [Streptomyces microflavus]MDX2979754.1 DUF6193 family natural product biosynthesis protein [Streptomyces sp. NRRL_B-2249]GFN05100.1 hypothetical protein Smic_36560 [Streptomyces microflavus]GGX50579.1 hypothetical protein GCM10010298_12720 [Streptomyces microflavus]
MTSNEAPRNDADVVAAEWAAVLSYGTDLINPAVPRTAYGHPSLRVLWPMVSHGVLYLSRCTGYPWSRDVGTAFPQGGGGYRVRRESDKALLGEVDTMDEAYKLIAATLPEGCGPAVDGTPDDL